jgi:hypothetical protein
VVKIFGKSGKSEINWPLVILVVIAVMIAFPAIPDKISTMFGLQSPATPGTTPATTGTGGVPAGGCYVDSTTVTLTSEEMYTPGTAATGDALVWINGAKYGQVAQGASVTMSPGDSYQIMWSYNSTAGATRYYKKVTSGTVPCSGTLKLHEKLYSVGLGSAATSFANAYSDTGVVSSATTGNSTVYSPGQAKQFRVVLNGEFKKAIGDPYLPDTQLILSCKYNTSAFQKVTLGTFPTVSTPSSIATTSAYTWTSVALPSLKSIENTQDFIIVAQADNTYAPVGDASDIFCQLNDGDYYVDSVTGAIAYGIQNDAKASVGRAATGANVWNFTIQTV